MTASSLKATALSVTLAGAALCPTSPMAQSENPGGIQMTFGLSLRLEGQDNRLLDPESAGNSFEASTGLSFGLLTETRRSRLSFDASGRLRSIDTPTVNLKNGFVEPNLALSYAHESANTQLSFDASLRETDLTNNDLLTEESIEIITSGAATRRYANLEGRINWGTSAPFGYGLLARIEDTTYRDGLATGLAGTTLNDSRRTSLGASARLDFSKAASLSMELTFADFEEDGTLGTRQTVSLDNRLTLDRPLGHVTLDLNITKIEEGTRVETALGRKLEMPLGTLSGQIGATNGTNGNTVMTGKLDYSHALPRGALNFGLARDISSSNDQDIERFNSRVNFSYLQELTPLSAIRFTANWGETEETVSGLKSANASLGATYSYELTQDWNLDVGYLHRYREDDIIADDARSNTLFVEFRRVFTGRF